MSEIYVVGKTRYEDLTETDLREIMTESHRNSP